VQHKDMLPFLSTSVLENEGNEKSYFFISVSKNATEGIFRGYLVFTPGALYHNFVAYKFFFYN